MIKEFRWVAGKEIKTFEDIKEAVDGFFIKDAISCFAHDQDIILTKNKEYSMERLADIYKQGAKVYKRVKEFREPVFDRETDYKIDDLVGEFIFDFDEEFARERAFEEFLKKLKNIIEKRA